MELLALAVLSDTLVAVMVRLAKLGNGVDGAVYFPVLLTVPMADGDTPDGAVNDHLTAVLVAPATVAVNCRVPLTGTETGEDGLKATVTAALASPVTKNSVMKIDSKRGNSREYIMFPSVSL